jgi:hypothetical protein
MNIKQKVLMLALVVTGSLGLGMASPVSALECGAGVKTSIIGGDICDGVNNESGVTEENAIWKLLILALNILTAGVGILAVGGIVYASVLYTTARDTPDQAKKAMDLIREIVFGLVAYALMYIFLNFLIPGGVFK